MSDNDPITLARVCPKCEWTSVNEGVFDVCCECLPFTEEDKARIFRERDALLKVIHRGADLRVYAQLMALSPDTFELIELASVFNDDLLPKVRRSLCWWRRAQATRVVTLREWKILNPGARVLMRLGMMSCNMVNHVNRRPIWCGHGEDNQLCERHSQLLWYIYLTIAYNIGRDLAKACMNYLFRGYRHLI
jgi:hypothetical protein